MNDPFYNQERESDGPEISEIDKEYLLSIGFLPDGHPDNGDMAIRLWDITETESDGREPAMHLVYSLGDDSLWLETYGSGGESLCLVELKPRKTKAGLQRLCYELGILPPEKEREAFKE